MLRILDTLNRPLDFLGDYVPDSLVKYVQGLLYLVTLSRLNYITTDAGHACPPNGGYRLAG